MKGRPTASSFAQHRGASPWDPELARGSCRASRIRLRIARFSAAGPVSCCELLGRPNLPHQARDLGSNLDGPPISPLVVR